MPNSSCHYRAGAARECITPNEPLWLAGYAARTSPARGKISELFAAALAIEDEAGKRVVIASVELIAITPIISNAVYEAARLRHGLSREQILLTATHTHYGPEFRPDKALFFKIPAEYEAKLVGESHRLAAALTRVIDTALDRLQPARLYARSTTAGFAHNRRRHGVKDGRPSEIDLFDHDVPVLDCVDASGRRIAILFGYACHNTTIPPEDLRYCGDWAGFASERLQASNDGAIALFIPGAGADQDPEPSGTVELSRQHGEEIASVVERSLADLSGEVTGMISVASEEVSLPLETVTTESLEAMLASGDPPRSRKARFLLDQLNLGVELVTSYPAPLQLIRFGREMLLIALSGEPVVDWALQFKAEFRGGRQPQQPTNDGSQLKFPLVWVAGYCNDMFGYLPTRRVQREGGYEAGRAMLWSWLPAPFTADVEDHISGAVRRLVQVVSC